MQHRFAHESLDAYTLALEVCRWFTGLEFPRGWAWLKDQAVRASGSVVLNIAEGQARVGEARRHHYRIAMGSAAEACAALDILPVDGAPAVQAKLRRVAAMLARLSR